jgi:hypothetical protein
VLPSGAVTVTTASPLDSGYTGLIDIVQPLTGAIPAPGDVRKARPPAGKHGTEGGLVTVTVRVRHLTTVFGGSVLVTVTVFVADGAGFTTCAAGLMLVEPQALSVAAAPSAAMSRATPMTACLMPSCLLPELRPFSPIAEIFGPPGATAAGT